jgi:hypothetical protein
MLVVQGYPAIEKLLPICLPPCQYFYSASTFAGSEKDCKRILTKARNETDILLCTGKELIPAVKEFSIEII